MSEKKNKKSAGLGLALWLIAAIILFIMFLINWNKIASNLKETGFFGKVFGKTPEFIEKVEVADHSEEEKNDVEPVAPVEIDIFNKEDEGSAGSKPSAAADETVVSGNENAEQRIAEVAEEKKIESENEKKSNAADEKQAEESSVSQETKKQPVIEAPKTMNLKLYFMEISSNGSVVRHEVTRSMPKSDSPLADSINALIKGPNTEEESMGCKTLVSNGTRLIGASVKNGVATLNFSAEFEFNQFGIEGTRGQLQQIVYTATAFPTVDSVQFLVEGEKKEYLGQEGVWIGTPLNRGSFY